MTRLHDAVREGNAKKVKALLTSHWWRKAEDVQAVDDKGNSPLHLAASVEVAEVLLAALADVNAKNRRSGRTPLHLAVGAEVANAELAKLLISRGADVNPKDLLHWTPLHLAANAQLAGLLISHGADIRTDGGYRHATPFHTASAADRKDVVELLLKSGVDPRTKAGDGSTALFGVGAVELAESLVAKGVDPRTKDRLGRTALFGVGTVEVAKLLIGKGLDPNAQDREGSVPLHFAASKETAAFFISKGNQVNARSVDGKTPLFWAAYSNKKELVLFLLEKGAVIDSDYANSPARAALDENNGELAMILLARGATIKMPK